MWPRGLALGPLWSLPGLCAVGATAAAAPPLEVWVVLPKGGPGPVLAVPTVGLLAAAAGGTVAAQWVLAPGCVAEGLAATGAVVRVRGRGCPHGLFTPVGQVWQVLAACGPPISTLNPEGAVAVFLGVALGAAPAPPRLVGVEVPGVVAAAAQAARTTAAVLEVAPPAPLVAKWVATSGAVRPLDWGTPAWQGFGWVSDPRRPSGPRKRGRGGAGAGTAPGVGTTPLHLDLGLDREPHTAVVVVTDWEGVPRGVPLGVRVRVGWAGLGPVVHVPGLVGALRQAAGVEAPPFHPSPHPEWVALAHLEALVEDLVGGLAPRVGLVRVSLVVGVVDLVRQVRALAPEWLATKPMCAVVAAWPGLSPQERVAVTLVAGGGEACAVAAGSPEALAAAAAAAAAAATTTAQRLRVAADRLPAAGPEAPAPVPCVLCGVQVTEGQDGGRVRVSPAGVEVQPGGGPEVLRAAHVHAIRVVGPAMVAASHGRLWTLDTLKALSGAAGPWGDTTAVVHPTCRQVLEGVASGVWCPAAHGPCPWRPGRPDPDLRFGCLAPDPWKAPP